MALISGPTTPTRGSSRHIGIAIVTAMTKPSWQVIFSWIDGDGIELLRQDLVVALRPLESGEHSVEIQLRFLPGKQQHSTTLEQTNFGFLAVRVRKSLSAYFGGGRLTGDAGVSGEPSLHEKTSRWMDYSGPVPRGVGTERTFSEEGITYFDHPKNLSFPTFWHVRNDGWMGASPGMKTPIEVTEQSPLVLRYLLHAHQGPLDVQRAEIIAKRFYERPGFRIRKPNPDERHRQFEVERKGFQPKGSR